MNVMNGDGQTPSDLARLLFATKWTEVRILLAAGENNLETLTVLASGHCQHKKNRNIAGFRQCTVN
jgi:hypothetical protein